MSNNGRFVKAIVYDLPSENQREFRGEEVKNKVRSVRVTCVVMLHSLGVQCTESVVLVPQSNIDKINEVIRRVQDKYNTLSEELRRLGYVFSMRPLIQVLNLTSEQVQTLIPIAQRRLIELMDQAIDRVSEVLEEIATITEESRLRSIRSSLTRLRRNWSQLFQYARELGIDISRDYEYLVELIDQAIERCE